MLNNCKHDFVDVTYEVMKATELSEYGGGKYDCRYHYCCRKCLKQISVTDPMNEPARKRETL